MPILAMNGSGDADDADHENAALDEMEMDEMDETMEDEDEEADGDGEGDAAAADALMIEHMADGLRRLLGDGEDAANLQVARG